MHCTIFLDWGFNPIMMSNIIGHWPPNRSFKYPNFDSGKGEDSN